MVELRSEMWMDVFSVRELWRTLAGMLEGAERSVVAGADVVSGGW